MTKLTSRPIPSDRSRTGRWVAAVLLLALGALLAFTMRRAPDVAPQHDTASSERKHASRAARWKAPAPPVTSISGVVRDATGPAIAGAVVCAVSAGASAPERCADTGEQGVFLLSGLAAGGYVLHASALGFEPTVAEAGRALVLIDGQPNRDVVITLAKGGANLAGVVVDATGGVVPRAIVRATRLPGATNTIDVVADDEGRFALSTSAGSVALSAQSEGYCRSRLVYTSAPSENVTLVLVPESTIAGTVVTSDGQPVAGMRVSAEALGGVGMPSQLSAPTNEHGEFVVTGLGSGAYALSAEGDHRRGFEPGPFELDVADRLQGALIVVDAVMAVAGRVVMADDTPCASGKVTMTPSEGATSPLPSMKAPIDITGAVEFSAVPPGTYSVDVLCRNHVLRDGPRVVTVGSDDVSGLLWKVGLGLALEVRVIDELEEPVPHAPFMLQIPQAAGAPPAYMMATTNTQGTYEYTTTLLPGRYVVKANGTLDGEPVVVDLEEGQGKATATLRVEGSSYVTVNVRTSEGEAVNNVVVAAHPTGEAAAAIDTAAPQRPGAIGAAIGDGRYRVGPIKPGRYEVSVDDSVNPSSAPSRASVLVSSRAEAEATITLERGGSISGSVRSSAGAPLADVWVSVARAEAPSDSRAGLFAAMNRSRGMSPGHRVLTDAEGRFRLEDLESGASFDVRAEALKGGVAIAKGVRTGEVVTLSFSAVGTLRGAAFRDDGRPAVESSVQVTQMETGWSRVSAVRPDGSWELSGVAAGRVRVVAADDQGYFANNDLELRPNQTLDQIRLVLTPRHPEPPDGPPGPASAETPTL